LRFLPKKIIVEKWILKRQIKAELLKMRIYPLNSQIDPDKE